MPVDRVERNVGGGTTGLVYMRLSWCFKADVMGGPTLFSS